MNELFLSPIKRFVGSLSIILFLVACSSGGGSGGGNNTGSTEESLSLSIDSPQTDQTITKGNSVNFSSTVSGGTGPYIYQWDFGGGATNCTDEDPGSVIFDNLGTFIVILTVTDQQGNTTNNTRSITVEPPPIQVTIDSPTNYEFTIFAGEVLNFQSTVQGGIKPYSYHWDFDGACNDSSAQDPGSKVFDKVGEFVVRLTVTDSVGESSFSMRVIHVVTGVSGILSTNTTWSKANSPYIVTGDIQIHSGVTLTIEPGCTIMGDSSLDRNPSIVVFGSLNAIGTKDDMIQFERIDISSGDDPTYSTPNRICISNVEFLSPSSIRIERYGSFSITDSVMRNTRLSIVSTPSQNCYLERNIFINCSGISIMYLDTYIGENTISYIVRNNVLYSDHAYNWDTYDYAIDVLSVPINKLVLEYNSFLFTDRYVIRGENVNAANNFWNTTDTTIIDRMIHDRNDDLSLSSYIEYKPFLTKPHVNTPDPTNYIN